MPRCGGFLKLPEFEPSNWRVRNLWEPNGMLSRMEYDGWIKEGCRDGLVLRGINVSGRRSTNWTETSKWPIMSQGDANRLNRHVWAIWNMCVANMLGRVSPVVLEALKQVSDNNNGVYDKLNVQTP